jgi:release factor glutamine methyltransferase
MTGELATGRAIEKATELIAAAGVTTGARDAVLLAAHLWDTTPDKIDELSTAPMPDTYWDLVQRRVEREPAERITGYAYFHGRRFTIAPDVFVPKPETEELTERVVGYLRTLSNERPRVVDLCCGSGVVALTIARLVPGARVIGVDLSPQACETARHNAEEQGLAVDFVCADAEKALPDLDATADVVVANPPYIPLGHRIQAPEVRDHDPALALWAGPDGMAVIRAVEAAARRLLITDGRIFMEHGSYLNEPTLGLFTEDGWAGAVEYATVDDSVLVARRAPTGLRT